MSIKQKIEAARKELLDMGIRGNSMLHIPRQKKFLEIIEGSSSYIFDILVEQRRPMGFQALPEGHLLKENGDGKPTDNGELHLFLDDYTHQDLPELRQNRNNLQTRLSSNQLSTRLIKIENDAYTLLQEQGIDALYLALGFLEWYEDSNSRQPRFAPLLLLPVELTRESVRAGFKVSYTGGDLGPNLTLGAKLKGEFRIDLPDFTEEFDISKYLNHVVRAIKSQSRWQVHVDQIFLGLFSFGKFQMYIDLDPSSWPENRSLIKNQQIRKLFEDGFEKDASLVKAAAKHEIKQTPEKLYLVKDADSSQIEAILATMEGANLIIQGPPGTGKSQTITNLISEALSRNKKVLFVAQKMAALEVVKTRLDECSLGEAVLELHSHKSNKKTVLDSLKAVFDNGRPMVPDRSSDYQRLEKVRKKIDGYVTDIKTPVLNSGLNYIECLGLMLQLNKDKRLKALPKIDFNTMKEWGPEEIAEAKRAMEATEEYLNSYGPPVDNPFNRSRRIAFSPLEEERLKILVSNGQQKLQKLAKNAGRLASAMKLPEPKTFEDIEILYRAGKRAIDAPHLKGVRVNTQEWQVRRDDIRRVISSGREMNRIRSLADDHFIPAIYEANLIPIRTGIAKRANNWWRIFSVEYRSARATLNGYNREKLSGKPNQWVQWLDELLAYQNHYEKFVTFENVSKTLFGAQWQGLESDWDVLDRIAEWIFDLYDAIGSGNLPEGIADFLEGGPDVQHWAEPIEMIQKQSASVQELIHEIIALIEWDKETRTSNHTIIEWIALLDVWQDTGKIYNIVQFNNIQKRLEKAGLFEVIEKVFEWCHSSHILVNWLLYSYYAGLVNTAYSLKPRIGGFDRLAHERDIREFKQLDAAVLSYARETLVARMHEKLPSFNATGEMDILRREFNKKRRHIPIRRLIREAGNVIQEIKPVFMMSPMSVATYLPQDMIDFDLVIFDEASQIPAPQALGAIARGSQVVVVGDSKQMPPTNFFEKALEIDDDEAYDSVTADVESILGLMNARGVPDSMLRWHYRSRHHSLIQVSNDQFYENKLLIFPSPGVNPQAKGLSFHHSKETIYDRGRSRANQGEARVIAQQVMEHALHKPELSLGVVSFSTSQRDTIVLEVERLRRENPETEHFFKRHDGSREFFIKNLENVQGDERDVIYISVGYGRTQSGQTTKQFGPINKKGGERRLNVLISRARLAMKVFANFTAEELRIGQDVPFGVRVLKTFLYYAEKGELPQNLPTGREPDSPFEMEVLRAIEKLGYEAEPQVGCNGFFIDMAVCDPQKPGRYILAVECDGASYHSTAIARDRDRLRQAVLEDLGWRFHRIWSTDWFRNATVEKDRLKEAIEGALLHQKRNIDDDNDFKKKRTHEDTKTVDIAREKPTESFQYKIPEYEFTPPGKTGLRHYDKDFYSIGEDRLQNAIIKIIETEGPLHFDLLVTRLVEAVGLRRKGPRIQSRVKTSINKMAKKNQLIYKNYFLSLSSQIMKDQLPLRNWAVLQASQRKFEYVPTIEITHAIFLIIADGYSAKKVDCANAAAGLIGFKRLSAPIRKRIEAIIDKMVHLGVLVNKTGRLQLSDQARKNGLESLVTLFPYGLVE